MTRKTRAKEFADRVRASGDYRWVGIYDVTPDEVKLIDFSGPSAPVYPRFPVTRGLTGAAVASCAPVISNDVRNDPRYLTAFDSTGSELILPLLDERGRAVGTIDVESDRVNAFTSDDVARLGAAAVELLPLFVDCTVRVATADDAEAVARIYAPYVTDSTISFEETPPTGAEMRKRILDTLSWYPWIVAENSGDVVGYAYAGRHRARAAYRWAVDTSVYVDEAMCGRGFGRRLYDELFRTLERQGFRRACAGIALPNAGSEALHRAVGFTDVGIYRNIAWKRGAWRDVLWLERPIGTVTDDPADPVPFHTLGWASVLRET